MLAATESAEHASCATLLVNRAASGLSTAAQESFCQVGSTSVTYARLKPFEPRQTRSLNSSNIPNTGYSYQCSCTLDESAPPMFELKKPECAESAVYSGSSSLPPREGEQPAVCTTSEMYSGCQ